MKLTDVMRGTAQSLEQLRFENPNLKQDAIICLTQGAYAIEKYDKAIREANFDFIEVDNYEAIRKEIISSFSVRPMRGGNATNHDPQQYGILFVCKSGDQVSLLVGTQEEAQQKFKELLQQF